MKRLLVFAFVFVCAMPLNGSVSAQSNGPINHTGMPVAVKQVLSGASLPVAPGVIYRMLTPQHLDTFSSDTHWAFQLGGRYVTAGTPAFGVQLDLPQGAQLVEASLFYVDNAAGAIDMTLYAQTPDSTTATPLASANTTGVDSPAIRSISLTGAPITIIDNAQRYDYIEITLPSATANHRVHGLRIGYKYTATFLPLIRRE